MFSLINPHLFTKFLVLKTISFCHKYMKSKDLKITF